MITSEINQFNNIDLNIKENTLKHQNVNVPTEYSISEEEKKSFPEE